MTGVHLLAIDLAKRSLEVWGSALGGAYPFHRMVSRAKLETILREQAPCIVAIEACATSHFEGRFAESLRHEVRRTPPIFVKPFFKRQKNEAANAAGIAETALRPDIHYLSVKGAEHQAHAVAFRTHQSFFGQRAQIINAWCGRLAEFGFVVAQMADRPQGRWRHDGQRHNPAPGHTARYRLPLSGPDRGTYPEDR